MDIQAFKHDDWTTIWAGTWRLLTCSHFSDQYTKEILFNHRPFQSQSIIVVTSGKSSAWMRQADKDVLGNYLAGQVRDNQEFAIQTCETLKKKVDEVLEFMRSHSAKDTDLEVYKELWRRIVEYYAPHITVKYIVDYLKPDELESLLPHFEEARIYAEPVFKESEDFMQELAAIIGGKAGIEPSLISCLVKEELFEYFSGGRLPGAEVLKQRDQKALLIADSLDRDLLVGEDAIKVEALVTAVERVDSLKGGTAFPGVVRGKVRIVLDPATVSDFEEGNVLVTGMTRPEYLPIMHKAAAVVTDAGGILSHAAITARELKKPCVIGTKNATKVFKDGDMVEVDATAGLVRLCNL